MTYSFPALSGRCITAILFGAGALVLVACQSTGFGTNPSTLGVPNRSVFHPATGAGPSYTWQSYNVHDTDNTEITGIENNLTFEAVTFPNAGTPYSSFIADLSSSSTITGPWPEPPNHNHVYLAELSSQRDATHNNYSVGYVAPASTTGDKCQPTTLVVVCGLVYDPDQGATYLLEDPKQGKHACAQTYLYGTSDPDIQVGYYTTGDADTSSGCTAQAVEEYSYPSGCSSPPCPQFVDFQFPSSFGTVTSSKAYGINNYGEVVGTFTNKATTPLEIGWELKRFTYTILQYQLSPTTSSTPAPNASPTEPRDISWSGSVVGSYRDSGGATHGFLRYYKSDEWYPENCCSPTSAMRTIIYGTNTPAYLVGAYKTTPNGSWNGFYAKCNSSC